MPNDTRDLEKELLARLEGVTPGQRRIEIDGDWAILIAEPSGVETARYLAPPSWLPPEEASKYPHPRMKEAEFHACSSPDNIRALLSTISDLRATVAEAVRVMEPFAKCGEAISERARKIAAQEFGSEDDEKIVMPDEQTAFVSHVHSGPVVSYGDLRAARAFTAKHGGENAE